MPSDEQIQERWYLYRDERFLRSNATPSDSPQHEAWEAYRAAAREFDAPVPRAELRDAVVAELDDLKDSLITAQEFVGAQIVRDRSRALRLAEQPDPLVQARGLIERLGEPDSIATAAQWVAIANCIDKAIEEGSN